MGVGDDFREGFVEMVEIMGCTVLFHKNWSKPDQLTTEVRGLKNSEKHRPSEVMFQFLEDPGIQPGDVLQQKGARDLWRVTEVSDDVEEDVFIHFEAKVQKMNAAAPTPPAWTASGNQVVVHGSVFGALQVASPQAHQHVSIAQTSQVGESIEKLRDLLREAALPQLDKEEAALALDRVAGLAEREKTPDVLAKIKEKLDSVGSLCGSVAGLANTAAPYLEAIWKAITG